MSRYDDDRSSRTRGRDSDDRPSRGRGDDDDRGSSRRGRGDDDDRGGRRGGGRSYSYETRSPDQARKRSEQGGNDFDKILVDTVKMWKPNDGPNTIRLLPPTWKKPEHYGYDIFVHYGVGPDRQSYLCLHKMKGEPCPICEERTEAQRHGDEKYSKELEPKKRVLVYLVDRDHEKDGVQAWAMPWTVDRDTVKISTDRRSGEVLPIDHPEEGYDVLFEKKGAKDRTEYLGNAIDRRDSPLGKQDWLDFAMDHPLPEQLQFFDYDHIAKAFNGGGGSKPKRQDDDDRPSARGRGDDDRAAGRGRDSDDERPSRGRGDDDRGGRRGRGDDDDQRGRGRELPSWDDVHAMTSSELDAMAEAEGVNPSKFDSDEALAGAICDKMGIERKPRRHSPDRDSDERPSRGRGDDDDGDEAERLAKMRRGRDGDDERPTRRTRGD